MSDRVRVLHVTADSASLGSAGAGTGFERGEFEVRTAGSAAAALDALAAGPVDCVVSDHPLPDAGGLEFLDAVRERHPELPFILFTGGGSEALAGEAIARGADGYVPGGSPDQYDVLAARVERAVDERRGGGYERLFEAVFDAPDSFVGVLAPDGTVRRANETALAFADVEPDDVVGEPFPETPWWDHDPALQAELRGVIDRAADGEFVRFEATHVAPDGEEIAVDVSVRPVCEDGEVVALVAEGRDVTERRAHERVLQRYRTAIEAVGDAVYALDPEGHVTMVNDAAIELTGYGRTELLGGHIARVMDEADVARGREHIRELLAGDEDTSKFEMDLVARDGERIPCENHVAVLTEDGEFQGSVGVLRVIAERKRREGQLRALHAAARDLMACETAGAIAERCVEAARDSLELPYSGFFLWDEADELLRPSVHTEEAHETLGPPPTFERGEGIAGDVFDAGEPAILDDAHEDPRVPDDLSYPIHSYIVLPLGEHGIFTAAAPEVGAFDEVDVDVAQVLAATAEAALDRAAQRQALLEERDHFAALFENIPDPTIDADLTGGEPIIQRVNPAFEEVFGYGADEVVGHSIDDIIVPPEKDAEAMEYNELSQRGESFTEEVRRYAVDGPRDFILHVAPHTLGEHSTRGYAIYTDITELRERERELQRQNERLEEFASVVSHDLRNPLNVAEGRLELARETGEDEHFEAVERAHDRMDELISGLLALARQGRAVGETEPVALGTVVEDAWAAVDTGTATLEAGALPVVYADGERLRQLFENLFRNAVEHAGLDATVRVGALGDGFYVADDGPSIPREGRDKVFESGYTTHDDGTGFGLAIVKSIVEAHGWEIAVADSASGGASFEITGVAVENAPGESADAVLPGGGDGPDESGNAP